MYKEFVESFEDSEKGLNRAWIKGGVVNPEKGIHCLCIHFLVKLKSLKRNSGSIIIAFFVW